MRKLLNPLVALATIGVVAIAFVVGLAALPTRAADHLDAPGLTSPGGDSRLDLTDVYAFQSPNNSANTVLIMAVNPLAGAPSATTFHPKASYEFLIDDDSPLDGKPDTTIEVDFGKVKDGVQTVEIEIDGPHRDVNAEGRTGKTIKISGGGKLRAGSFDDPFFFDLLSFLDIDLSVPRVPFCEPGDGNFFLGLNVSAIVLEVPSGWLGPNNIGVWARTVLDGKQIDRMGRPAINTVFIPANVFEPAESSQKNAFNAGKPKNDQANFRGEVVDTLEIFYGVGSQTAQDLADILLPDILTVDTSSSLGFLNGRQLADDVIDAELTLVTNGAVTTDCVGNDSAFSGTFPYLAPKN